MKRRDLIKTIAITTLGAGIWTAAAPSASATDVDPGVDERRTLKVGETVRFDQALRVTFLKVSSDSRCPMNARCITAGDAEVLLEVKVSGRKAETLSLHTNDKPRQVVISALRPGTVGIPKSYTVRLARLTPQPTAGKKTRQRDYELTLGFSIAV